jgi:phosphomannomutase
MTNYGFQQAMQEAGIDVAVTRVGDRYVLEELRKRGWALGGEQSGHIIELGFAPTGDGIAAALLTVEALDGADLADRGAMRKLPQVLVNVEVADLPEVSAPKVAVLQELELVTLTPAIRAERGIRVPRGAVVYNVSDRVSNDIGIQRGDVIVQINRLPIASAADVQRAIESYAGRSAMRVVYERGGRVYYTDVVIQ